MEQDNKVSIEFTAEKQTAVKDAMSVLRTELSEFLAVNLTADERVNMLRMGAKSVDFVTRALDYASLNLPLVPAYMNLEEAKKDLALVQSLAPVIKDLSTILRGLEDLSMLAGSEAYDAALIFYHSLKGAGRAEVPGMQTIYDDLKRQFPRPSRKKQA